MLLAGLAGTPCQAAVIYSQSGDYPSGFNALTSQSQATGGSYEAYDNFAMSTAHTVAAMSFQGFYWNPTGPTVNPPALPPLQNLQVGFYTNVNNAPNTFLGSTTFTNFTFSKVGSAGFGPDLTGHTDTVDIYNFTGNLANTFSASANVTYWLSVVSFAPSSPVLWLWTSGSGGDGRSMQKQYTDGLYNATRDRTFSLYDTTNPLLGATLPPEELPSGELVDAPEPASLTLGVIGLTCVAGLRLRRRASAT